MKKGFTSTSEKDVQASRLHDLRVQAKQTRFGFTLFETLVYLAVSTLMIITIMSTLYPLTEGVQRSHIMLLQEIEASFATAKIKWALANATQVISPVEGESTALEVLLHGTVVRFSSDHGTLSFSENSGTPEPITASRVQVNAAHFSRRVFSPRESAVDFSIEFDRRRTPTTTIYVRY